MKKDGVFVIAEIGGNHEGDIEKARRLMHLAIESGADSIKFQVYSGDTLVNIKEDPERVAHFNRFSLSDMEYIELAKECISLGADFNASIWNERQIDLLNPYMSFYKIGSGDLTAYPLIKVIVSKKKPIVLSTGLSTMEEISSTIDFICSLDSMYKSEQMISILQCTSMYPIPNEDANLNVIRTLQETFSYPIGYSDHTEGVKAAQFAIALGAKIIEVHFTDDRRGKDFRDHKVSFTPDELKELKSNSNFIRLLLGDGCKQPMHSEIESDHITSFRRALYPACDIKKGQIIKESDLIALRPMHGISANNLMNVAGKIARVDIPHLSVLDFTFFK
jgi:N,N'-diacetyllegionaminate synthase